MRSILRRLASVLAIAAATVALTAGATPAAPLNAPNAQIVPLDCGPAGTFDVVVNGNGDWTPGHRLDGNGVVIPVTFGESTVVVRDAEGNVVEEGTEPAITKGSARARGRERIACSFTFTFEEDGFTVTVTGSATGFVSGPRS